MPGETLVLGSDLCLARRSAFTCPTTPSMSPLQHGYFGLWEGRGRSGTLPPQPLPFCKKRDQPSGTLGSLRASITPRKPPKPLAGRTVGSRESSVLGRCSGAEGEAGRKSVPPPMGLPSRSDPLLCPGGYKLLLFILHLLHYSTFQGPPLFKAVIAGGVGVLLSPPYSANTPFPHSTGQWL